MRRLPACGAAALLLALVAGCSPSAPAPSGPTPGQAVTTDGVPPLTRLAGPRTAGELDVMTFNVQDQEIGGAGLYLRSGRRRAAAQVVADARPDVIGTQELVPAQAQALHDDLARAGLSYAWYGRPRVSDEGGRPDDYNETVAVFWNTAVLDEVAHGDVFFCAPGEPAVQGCTDHGPGWTAGDPRLATWVRLRVKASGREVVVVNTHLDAGPGQAREHGARLVADLVKQVAGGAPLFLTGDFNSGTDSSPHQLLVAAGLVDTWSAAQRTGPDVSTFNRNAPAAAGPHIDRVYTRPALPVVASLVDTSRGPGGVLPSDHFPVVARVRLPG